MKQLHRQRPAEALTLQGQEGPKRVQEAGVSEGKANARPAARHRPTDTHKYTHEDGHFRMYTLTRQLSGITEEASMAIFANTNRRKSQVEIICFLTHAFFCLIKPVAYITHSATPLLTVGPEIWVCYASCS